jgi:lipoprotein NlpI
MRYTEDCENTTAVNAALLYYRGRALQALDLHEAARKVLTVALRRRKDRPEELLHAIRYARANSYAALGKGSRERSDLERIFAEDSDYADVARRLGVA